MTFEEISLSSFISEVKEVSDGAHPRKFCFVLGSGASRSSGIKSGQELVNIWDSDLRERNENEYNNWRKRLGITEENKYSFYSQYYEKRFYRRPTDGYNYIEKIMESAKPSAGYVMLAHLLTTTPHNVVITTNFDHLTEDAVNYYSQKTPLVIGHEVLAHYVSEQPVRATVIKIHRDLLFDPKSRTEEIAELHENWQRALTLIFSNYHPIFIGYAGNDKSLMEFLLKNADKFANNQWKFPYWMLYKNDKIEGNVKDFLSKSRGFFIRHSGFDEVLYRMGAAFDYTIPSDEDFLDDARKRYRTLADAIDAFSEGVKKSIIIEDFSEDNISSENTNGGDEKSGSDGDIDLAIQKVTGKSEERRMYRDSVLFYNDGNYEKALELREQLVRLDPENARYYNSLGQVLRNMKRNEEALVAFKRAVELAPENGLYHCAVAMILKGMKRYDEALIYAYKAVEVDPETAFCHCLLSIVLRDLNRNDEALSEIMIAIEKDPNVGLYYNALSDIYWNLENKEESFVAIKKAIELNPKHAFYYSKLSNMLMDSEKYDEALKAAQKAIDLEPSSDIWYSQMSDLLDRLDQTEKALENIEKAILIAPDKFSYYKRMGAILRKLGREEEAVTAEKRADEIRLEGKKSSKS